MPMGPPPNTTAASPGRGSARSTARYATDMGSTRAPWTGPRPSGSRWAMCSRTTVNSERPPPGPPRPWHRTSQQRLGSPSTQGAHVPHGQSGSMATRSPTATDVTSRADVDDLPGELVPDHGGQGRGAHRARRSTGAGRCRTVRCAATGPSPCPGSGPVRGCPRAGRLPVRSTGLRACSRSPWLRGQRT